MKLLLLLILCSCTTLRSQKYVCTLYATNNSSGSIPLKKCAVLEAGNRCDQSALDARDYKSKLWREFRDINTCSSEKIKKFVTQKYLLEGID